MKVAVFGAGGVGGYFGARLAAAGAEVHLLARGEHLEAIRERGLRVLSELGDVALTLPATDSPQAIGTSDVVLFCVKSTDTRRAAEALGPLLGKDTAVVSLQNGVENEDRLAEIIGREHVVGGVAYIFATIAEPGTIDHHGKLARMVFGELDGERTGRLERLLELCRKSGLEARLSESIRTDLWYKFAVICASAGMTAAVRLPLGEIRDSPAAFDMYGRIAAEVVEVARAEGVELPSDTVEKILETARSLPPHWYSSLHYDLVHGKPMELDALHGSALRLAQKNGIHAPLCEALFAILEPWATRNALAEKTGKDN